MRPLRSNDSLVFTFVCSWTTATRMLVAIAGFGGKSAQKCEDCSVEQGSNIYDIRLQLCIRAPSVFMYM
jgi:hypothetical protein